MRIIMLAAAAALIGTAFSVRAEGTPESDRSLRDTLPLFETNRCAEVRDTAGQLFCGDPELRSAGARLNAAVQERLNRIADRRMAIEENVEWIASRNLSCGIFDRQGTANLQIVPVKACLLKQTEERIAILNDPNFDCLATNTPAGTLICSDPSLAIADRELNGQVLALIGRMKKDEARNAFAEYARWTRNRDRRCNLTDKDNVPLTELSSSEACLAEYIARKTAEVDAAKGDPKRVFGRLTFSRTPDADAVDLCVAQIHAANACSDFLRISRIIQIDTEVSAEQALVTAEVEMKVVSPFAVCSPIASSCTGTCWDLRSGQAKSVPGSRDSLPIAHRLRIEKSFAFQKTDNGDWRCDTPVLQPIELGVALRGP
ncbi:lysozyme inhibitor LprI family protein [Bradyrhizobium lablabi]|uniref:lysozyme inhibitor LprI family protein n=1 Tax=Bradyrhizobium lablabi TaxID=722472 RepID=UPI00090C9DE2|nr:lysozyme inhibitor LprI family protein [Bradyrhizobium lablabi]SHL08539.1 Protein of unknown function [Bradyrhizobium lablabi]